VPRILCLLIVAAGCSKSDDARPNPALQVPDVPKGRAAGEGVPAQPGPPRR